MSDFAKFAGRYSVQQIAKMTAAQMRQACRDEGMTVAEISRLRAQAKTAADTFAAAAAGGAALRVDAMRQEYRDLRDRMAALEAEAVLLGEVLNGR